MTQSHKREMDDFTPFQPVDAVLDGAYGSGMAAESSVMPVSSLYSLVIVGATRLSVLI